MKIRTEHGMASLAETADKIAERAVSMGYVVTRDQAADTNSYYVTCELGALDADGVLHVEEIVKVRVSDHDPTHHCDIDAARRAAKEMLDAADLTPLKDPPPMPPLSPECITADNHVILTWGMALVDTPHALLAYSTGEAGGQVWLTPSAVRWLVEQGRAFLEGLGEDSSCSKDLPSP